MSNALSYWFVTGQSTLTVSRNIYIDLLVYKVPDCEFLEMLYPRSLFFKLIKSHDLYQNHTYCQLF